MGDNMQIKSIWLDNIKSKEYKPLDKDISVDVLIIGGGITGISTAYHLMNQKLKVCLVDRNKIGEGISSKTTGKLTYLQDNIYTKLSNKYNINIAKQYLNSQKEAIKLVENIINKHNIKCNYTKTKSYLFTNNEYEINKVFHESELLKYMKIKVNEEKIPLNIKYKYSISVNDTAYFNPVKYIKSLANIINKNNIDIYENTNIKEIKKDNNKYICFTNNNKIIAKKVVLALHYPFFIKPFIFPLKATLERGYISSSIINNNYNISGNIIDKNNISFRYYKNNNINYFIYSNNYHNLRNKYNIKDNFNYLLNDLKKLNITPQYIWSNIDIITNDYLPYIGFLEENLLIGTGYNAYGMTNGSIAGKIISDLILKNNNKYIKLFNPKRKTITIKNIIKNIYSSIKPFIINKIIKNKSYYSNKVIFTKKDNKDIAIYIDSFNNKHIVYNRCPHLKCNLIFNEVEKTWDCPCHSSRFDIDGKVIYGPSNKDITYKKEL